jgi:hypothetical protein
MIKLKRLSDLWKTTSRKRRERILYGEENKEG